MSRWITLRTAGLALLAPPAFADDEEKTRTARLLHFLLLFSALAGVIIAVVDIFLHQFIFVALGLALAAICLGAWMLLRRGRLQAAIWMFLIVVWMAGLGAVWMGGGTASVDLADFLVLIVVSGLFLGERGGNAATILGLLTVWGVFIAERYAPPTPLPPALNRMVWLSLLYIITGLLVRNSARATRESLEQRERDRRAASEAARELEKRSAHLEQWAARLESVAAVSRQAISIHDPEELLNRIVELIGERFNFYHVAIFLVDESGEYAVLRAASSEGGRQMLANGHKLQVGKQGIVGYVIAHDQPHIALDVGKDAVHFKNPFLPETRSEIALPLKVGGRVIGALDVQSHQANAFGDEDTMVLQMMADYLANTIENARLLSATRQAVLSLSSAAAEILLSTTQQAAAASQQSAAIAQTTTTVDELRAIAEQSVARAQEMAGAAQRTLEVSRGGRTAVQETIGGMAQIKARVEGIVGNILALAERMEQIGQIIASVNEITAQSNMLALNASIEAAHAGGSGKGFAVVAAEVRRLAEQSRQATAQIKAILADVLKAADATAAATQEGTQQADEGVQLAAQAQEAIEQLAEVIEESARAAAQLVAGGRQQATGVEQVALAMQSINQATTQNLANVRQAEKAARNLSDLAGRLSAIVQQYH